MTSGVFKGGDGATAPLFGLALNFRIFLRCFCKLRFVIEPRKIRVLSSHCPYFCLLETASECTQTYHFGGQKWFFSVEGSIPLFYALPRWAHGASPPYWNPRRWLWHAIWNENWLSVQCLMNTKDACCVPVTTDLRSSKQYYVNVDIWILVE